MTALTHHFARALERINTMRLLEKEHAQLSSEYKDRKNSLEELRVRVSQLERECHDLSNQKKEFQKSYEEAELRIFQLENEQDNISTTDEELHNALEAAKIKVSQLEEIRSENSAQVGHLIFQLTKTRATLDTRLQQLAKKEEEFSQQQATLDAQTRENTALKAKLKASNKKLDEAYQRWITAMEEVQSLERKNEQHLSEITQVTSWLMANEKLNDEHSNQVNGLVAKLAQYDEQTQQQELDTMRRDQEIAKLSGALLSAEQRLKQISVTRDASRNKQVRRNLIKEIQKSGLFDAQWYQHQYTDVAKSGLSPLEHFLKFGGQEGRDPSALFSSMAYFKRYPDVQMLRLNPLAHYLLEGRQQGCDVTPVVGD